MVWWGNRHSNCVSTENICDLLITVRLFYLWKLDLIFQGKLSVPNGRKKLWTSVFVKLKYILIFSLVLKCSNITPGLCSSLCYFSLFRRQDSEPFIFHFSNAFQILVIFPNSQINFKFQLIMNHSLANR